MMRVGTIALFLVRIRLSRWVRIRLGVVGLLALLFVLNFCTNVSTTYLAVTDPGTSRSMGRRDEFTTQSWLALIVPDYQVRDGKLYLLVQVTRPSMLVVTAVSFGDWDAKKVRQFRRNHAELEPLWPDGERPDGGVGWLRPAGPGR